MKQKLITMILSLTVIIPLLLITPGQGSNLLRLKILSVGGALLLILLLVNYKTLTLDKKDIVILVFMGLVMISTCLSSNKTTSVLGEKYRYEGLLMFATYVCIYLSAKKYFKYKKISIFINIMFFTSMAIGILGIMQKYINTNKFYPIFSGGIFSTFGNPNFFGSFISIVLPIAVSVFLLKGSKRAAILSLIMFFDMVACGTRSAWVAALIVGIIIIIYGVKQKNKTYFKRISFLLICFIMIWIYLFYGVEIAFKEGKVTIETSYSDVRFKAEKIKMEYQQSQNEENLNIMGSGRIEIWKMTLKLISKQPIFGCGTDNLKNGLAENCGYENNKYMERTRTYVDKAHNEYLHIAATIGIPALICYLLFIALILIPKIKLILNNDTYFIICLAIISYLVQAFFNISVIGIAPLFWMLLGLSDNKDFINKLEYYIGGKIE